MRKPMFFILLAVFVSLGCRPLFAQLASDPSDRMYTDLKLWEDRGLLKNLPPLKPYPIQLLKKLLGDVQERGDDRDRVLAAAYLSEMNDLIDIYTVGGAVSRTDFSSLYGEFTLGGTLQGSILPWVTYSGSLGGLVNNGPASAILPEYQRSMVDFIYDGAVKPLGPTSFVPRVSSASSAAFGSDSFYFQAGNIRGSYGPFWGDNAILSPSAPQAGQFSYVFRHDYFTVTEVVLAMSATSNDGTGGPSPNKFLSFHSLELYPLPWLTFSVFESIVWGGRFELLYTLPFAVYYYAQGLGGFPDNTFIGLSGGIKLPQSVRADFILYVDDAAFNDLIKLNLNTMLVFSFQAGVSWTPNLPWLTRLSLNGIAITPYTYSHTDDRSPADQPGLTNYLNYTNSGQNIGPSLQPNSLRLEISALSRPVPTVDVNTFLRMVIHGNASDGIYSGTGTIFDTGYASGGATFAPPYNLPSGFGYTRFLTQSVLEKTFQAGLDAKWYLQTSIARIQLSLSYTFEYILNAGLSGGATAINNYLGLGLTFSH
jgi:hypothetical protein